MTSKLALLAPQPQELLEAAGSFPLSGACVIRMRGDDPSMLSSARWLQRALARHGVEAEITARPGADAGDFLLAVDASLSPQPQSYRLLVEPSGVFAAGGDGAGLFYAVCTLCQLLDLYGDEDGDRRAAARTAHRRLAGLRQPRRHAGHHPRPRPDNGDALRPD